MSPPSSHPGSAAAPSRWIKSISTAGTIRGIAIQATSLVREMAAMHQAKGAVARGLGEAVIGGLLLGSYCKSGERVNLNVQGSGGFSQALVDAHPDGRVRGYVIPRLGAAPWKDDVAVDPEKASGPWGSGLLSVLRTKDQEGERPYIGTVPLVTGHLAKDLTFYWVQSEQVPSSVGIVVDIVDDEIRAAGGFLIQALPGASASDVRQIEEHINQTDRLASEFGQSNDPMEFLSRVLRDVSFVKVEERKLQSYCNCSQERVERALTLVGVDELRSMLQQDRGASVTCDFCVKEYRFDEQGLERLIERTTTGRKGNSTLH